MTDVNSVVLVGRIATDVDSVMGGFGYTSGGTAFAKISIAVNKSRKQGEQWVDEAYFFNVTIWGKSAENLKPYLRKGQQIAIKGFLKQDRWKDKATGQNRSGVGVVAEQIELCGGGQNSGAAAGSPYQGNSGYTPGTGNAPAQFSTSSSSDTGFQDGGFPDDIPF